MPYLVHNHIIFQCTIPPRTSIVKNIQPQLPINPICHRSEESIISPRSHLHGGRDPVVALAAFVEIVRLKIERWFRESVAIGEVVDCVDYIEDVSECCVEVSWSGWIL